MSKEITIKQNKEIPTGKIIVKLKNDDKSIYVSDVNKVSDDIEEINNNAGNRHPTLFRGCEQGQHFSYNCFANDSFRSCGINCFYDDERQR